MGNEGVYISELFGKDGIGVIENPESSQIQELTNKLPRKKFLLWGARKGSLRQKESPFRTIPTDTLTELQNALLSEESYTTNACLCYPAYFAKAEFKKEEIKVAIEFGKHYGRITITQKNEKQRATTFNSEEKLFREIISLAFPEYANTPNKKDDRIRSILHPCY